MIIRDSFEIYKSKPICHKLKSAEILWYDIKIFAANPFIRIPGKPENILISNSSLCFFAKLPIDDELWNCEIVYEI